MTSEMPLVLPNGREGSLAVGLVLCWRPGSTVSPQWVWKHSYTLV